jgi:hypothetical protein
MERLPSQFTNAGRPANPPGLSTKAASEWDRLIKELEESDIHVAKAHGRLVEQAAEIVADIVDAKDGGHRRRVCGQR